MNTDHEVNLNISTVISHSMVGTPLAEVCGSIIFGLTRSVAEYHNPNYDESDPELFGFNPI